MVNNTVFDYFRKNRGKYPIDALKAKALAAGYSPKDIEDAIVMTEKQVPSKDDLKEQMRRAVSAGDSGNLGAMARAAGIFGVLFFLMYLVLLNLWVYFGINIPRVFNLYVVVPLALLLGLYYFTFFKIGSRDDIQALKYSAISKAILALIFPVAYGIFRQLFLYETYTVSGISAGVGIFYFLLFLAGNYYFSIGLLKNSENSRFAKPSGIFNLIYSIAATVIAAHVLYLYFSVGSFSFSILSLKAIYWEFIVMAVFATSAFFFESMALFLEKK